MPIQGYGVLKGRPIQRKTGTGDSPHYQVLVVDSETEYRIAINIESTDGSEVQFLVEENFQHPVISNLEALQIGYTALDSQPGGLALDYIRDNLLNPDDMVALPPTGRDGNDLDDKLDKYITRAMSQEEAVIYAFGQRWGPEHKRDPYFGFTPGNGIHDIHMNQGNDGSFTKDDGTWQDGGLIIYLPAEQRYVAIFLKFQTQTWHTDDQTGHRIETTEVTEPAAQPTPTQPRAPQVDPTGQVCIVAAVINPLPDNPTTITLLNATPDPIDLTGWVLIDRRQDAQKLQGTIVGGAAAVIKIDSSVHFDYSGGIITLLNEAGLKVHGVSYTQNQLPKPGWSLVF
jgi:uncharacterized protein YukJ